VRKTFDIVYDINMRYQIMFDRYRRHETSISITLFMTFDNEVLSPSISNSVTFDIEHLRYRYTTSNVKNMDIELAFDTKSSISNVALDIESPTIDIGVARIQMV
jgi:hypothetical protein